MTFNEAYEMLDDMELFTEEELNIASYFGGATKETLDALCFYRFGLRTVEEVVNGEE